MKIGFDLKLLAFDSADRIFYIDLGFLFGLSLY